MKGNYSTEILGHLEINSKSLPFWFFFTRDLNSLKKDHQPHVQNGLSNEIVIV